MLSLILLAVAQSERLAELTRSSLELRSFSAVYEHVLSLEAGKSLVRIDYVAPGKLRIDRSLGATSTSMWCVDGMLAVASTEGDKGFQGRVDCRGVVSAIAPLRKALRDAYPDAPDRDAPGAAVGMSWGFDAKTQQATFAIDAQFKPNLTTPLGWLETLKEKKAFAREDGDPLRFETDDRFQIAIGAKNGFLQELSGTGPKGKMHLDLISLEIDKPIDGIRFAIPAAPSTARDVSAELLRSLRRSVELDLRSRIYSVIAGAGASSPWDDAALSRISSVLRPFYDHALLEALESKGWFENNLKIQKGVAERLAGMRKAGKGAEEVEQARQREVGYLTKQLDKLKQESLTRLGVPTAATDLPRAQDLLEQERQVLAQVFEARVREPVMAGFEAATKG